MLKRGSAQLLLLFFRLRPRLGWSTVAIASLLVLIALLQAGGEFPLLTRTGPAQLLRQSAWQHALKGLPEQAPWPWAETSSRPAASVPQLGLSASVITVGGAVKKEGAVIEPIALGQDPHLSPADLGKVSIGDKITVTSADGSSRVYRVTGRKVVDPHLAETETGAAVTCLPLAAKVDPETPPALKPEQKL